MKQRNRARSSSLFLTELIIAILFFTACSAVCVQFFVKSHTMSQQAQELNFAVNECSTVAELLQASDSGREITENLTAAYPECEYAKTMFPTQFCMFFNSDFKPTSSFDQDWAYCMFVDIKRDGAMIDCNIDFSPSGCKIPETDNSIYKLEIKHNLQEVTP